MAYTRRMVYFDRQGRKKVVFRSMGDGPVTDPSQVDNDGEIQMPDDYVGSGFDPSQSDTVATVGPSCVGPNCKPSGAPGDPPPPAGTPVVNTDGGAVPIVPRPSNSLLLVAALAGGAWFLFGRKKGKR